MRKLYDIRKSLKNKTEGNDDKKSKDATKNKYFEATLKEDLLEKNQQVIYKKKLREKSWFDSDKLNGNEPTNKGEKSRLISQSCSIKGYSNSHLNRLKKTHEGDMLINNSTISVINENKSSTTFGGFPAKEKQVNYLRGNSILLSNKTKTEKIEYERPIFPKLKSNANKLEANKPNLRDVIKDAKKNASNKLHHHDNGIHSVVEAVEKLNKLTAGRNISILQVLKIVFGFVSKQNIHQPIDKFFNSAEICITDDNKKSNFLTYAKIKDYLNHELSTKRENHNEIELFKDLTKKLLQTTNINKTQTQENKHLIKLKHQCVKIIILFLVKCAIYEELNTTSSINNKKNDSGKNYNFYNRMLYEFNFEDDNNIDSWLAFDEEELYHDERGHNSTSNIKFNNFIHRSNNDFNNYVDNLNKKQGSKIEEWFYSDSDNEFESSFEL